ncbi:glycosyltransferase family 4 protein [Roseibacillus persicicus]|uniref:Glycosyl transferase n=1 Tax=Roseibacillus persicicus TaxID=454148 RepID=A0A918WJY9_9BACT|nr:glycosyltransferase family 4 protein [Roseibacillus persicicus]MDQ8191769.1 glycosyltransferase family 4 protein [Roseibacillus persicicus]GHC58604.1 glycosyl transferase [Roseibacillus persicicus]
MRLGFVSTRFAGTDGVSLEALKWAEVLEEMGHEIFWFSGLSDRPEEVSMCVPEAFFGHPENQWLAKRIWGHTQRDPTVTERIQDVAGYLKEMLRRFVDRFQIDVLVPENALTIPVHLPLGVAITEFLAETNMKAVAHHHDFYWERDRFAVNAVPDFLDMSFPPRLPNLRHGVINRQAGEQLARRKGVSSILVPNVFQFEKEPPGIDDYSRDVRSELGLADDDIFILQPTRVVPRKGIEMAIKLVARLKDPRCKLVISHQAGDEGFEYVEMLKRLAAEEQVTLLLVGDRVGENRQRDKQGRKVYTLWDLYPHADLVTYPSTYEGFGNALIETFYFRKPVVVNRYSIFVQDIEPKGFDTITMNGYVTHDVVERTRMLLADEDRRDEMVQTNYELGKKHYGYEHLKKELAALFAF